MTGVADMCQVQDAVRNYCRKLKLGFIQTEATADRAMHLLRTHGADEAIRLAKQQADKYAHRFIRQTHHVYKHRPAPMSA